MHCKHTAEALELVALGVRFSATMIDLAEVLVDGIVE